VTETGGTGLKNAAMLRLRVPSVNAGALTNNTGEIHVIMVPNGSLEVRQYIGGTWVSHYYDNPISGSAYSLDVVPGALPAMFGGSPFDVDGDGTLFDEPFSLGAVMNGTRLDVLVNGVNVAPNITSSASLLGPNNYLGFGKQRTISGGTPAIKSNIYYDNVVIIPEPGTVIMLLAGVLGLMVFRRRR